MASSLLGGSLASICRARSAASRIPVTWPLRRATGRSGAGFPPTALPDRAAPRSPARPVRACSASSLAPARWACSAYRSSSSACSGSGKALGVRGRRSVVPGRLPVRSLAGGRGRRRSVRTAAPRPGRRPAMRGAPAARIGVPDFQLSIVTPAGAARCGGPGTASPRRHCAAARSGRDTVTRRHQHPGREAGLHLLGGVRDQRSHRPGSAPRRPAGQIASRRRLPASGPRSSPARRPGSARPGSSAARSPTADCPRRARRPSHRRNRPTGLLAYALRREGRDRHSADDCAGQGRQHPRSG